MAYENLTDDQLLAFSETIPQRPDVERMHSYIEDVRTLVDGDDQISIPDTHKSLAQMESHEGSNRLNKRIRQGAAWLSRGEFRFSVRASGPGSTVQRGSSKQERFLRNAERLMGRGTGIHRWKQESNRDLMECGLSVVQQTPLSDYYVQARENPSTMASGALLTDVMFRRRVDPITVGWVQGDNGGTPIITVRGKRHMGEIARRFGLERAQAMLGYFDFGEPVDAENESTWGGNVNVITTEIWTPDRGALIVSGGDNPKASFRSAGTNRIVATWNNPLGKPPFYFRAFGTSPWHSPLDEMVQLTGARNWFATMMALQSSGAAFRHWQLIDTNNGDDITSTVSPSDVPMHIRFDMSKPPPFMGPGTEWRLAPFEWHDLEPQYDRIVTLHELAGASIARLMGESVNQNTAVGTADFLDESAQTEFQEIVESVEDSTAEMWTDFFRWHRNHHKDPIWVFDQKRDTEDSPTSFLSTTTDLRAEDIVSEHVEVSLDLRSELRKLGDFRTAVEKITQRMADFSGEVERGNIPDVDDAAAEKLAIFVSEGERITAMVKLRALEQQLAQNAGLLAPPESEIGFLGAQRPDPRSLGTGRGPDNVSDTGIAAGGSDIARSA